MKRMHIHVGVDSIEKAIEFYSALFGAQPSKVKPDYAKWMLDDPRINFAISTRSGNKGLDHLGLQVDDEAELEQIRDRISANQINVIDEGQTVCCYAESDKSWVEDPAGIPWEAYHTMADAQLFSATAAEGESACCAPTVTISLDSIGRGKPSNNKTGCC